MIILHNLITIFITILIISFSWYFIFNIYLKKNLLIQELFDLKIKNEKSKIKNIYKHKTE